MVDCLNPRLKLVMQLLTVKSYSLRKRRKLRGFASGLFPNHAFLDGNKLIGIYVLLTFLEVNVITLKATDDELIEVGLSLAQSEMKYEDLLQWIYEHENN